MITLALRFPGGRYHATPWGHHVNEGLAEWPPSPWRLLRAFIATGFTKLGWQEIPETGRCLIERLAGVLPSYRLPNASLAHSRHYMPIGKLTKGREDTTLVFDTWARVGDGEILVAWDVDLPEDELGLFTELAEKMSYLGRSESWVAGRVSSDPGGGYNCLPCGASLPSPKQEQVAVLAPVGASEYLSWRKSQTSSEAPKAKKTKSKSADDPIPLNILACLQVETQWLQKHGWSQPPGSRRVFYMRQTDGLQVGPPQLASRREAHAVSAMLLSLSTHNRNKHALPPITRTLPQADLLHRALVSHADPLKKGECPVLTGTDSLRNRLKLDHCHAHLLPLDADADGHLDHILIWAPMGLNAQAQNAIRGVRIIPTKGSVGELQVRLIGSGELTSLGQPVVRLIHASKTWRSLTPFVPPRYMKRGGKNKLEAQVAAELRSRNFPEPVEIKLQSEENLRRFRQYIRHRTHGNQPPVDCGFALQIRFAETVFGPMCLGYASHFGLGVFVSEP